MRKWNIRELVPAQRLARYLKRCEKDYTLEALGRCSGHLGDTAEYLGIDRKTLYRKLRTHGLVKAAAKMRKQAGVVASR